MFLDLFEYFFDTLEVFSNRISSKANSCISVAGEISYGSVVFVQ